MKTKRSSIILVIIFTLITAISQTLMKIGADKGFFNMTLVSSLALYAIGTIIFIIALKGGELSKLYPLISLSFVWVTLSSIMILKEIISLTKITGIITIILGIIIMGAD